MRFRKTKRFLFTYFTKKYKFYCYLFNGIEFVKHYFLVGSRSNSFCYLPLEAIAQRNLEHVRHSNKRSWLVFFLYSGVTPMFCFR